MRPTVSIILPTYNRARFLPQALESIRAQQWTDWELMIVDDGSTDETSKIIGDLTCDISQPVLFLQQENQGAYGARNTGLDHASGKYIAFYDSDDLWLPQYLKNGVTALQTDPKVDWVFSACRIVDETTGKVIDENIFQRGGKPVGFMNFQRRQSGKMWVIEEADLALQILRGNGLYAGLQNSIIRSEVFADARFEAEHRNEAEDQVFVILAALAGRKFGYIDEVVVEYRVHTENSSGASAGQSWEKMLRLYKGTAEGFERLALRAPLTHQQRLALNHLVSKEYFWHLGYGTLWKMGQWQECSRVFRKAIRLNPTRFAYWKTYVVCKVKSMLVRP